MLKDLFITLSLLCLCFALVIVLHSWSLQREINMLISTLLLTWALLKYVDHRAFFQTSISLIIAILLMLQQYEQIVWMGLGLFSGILLYKLPKAHKQGLLSFTNLNRLIPTGWFKKPKSLRHVNSDHV
ncbi:hypothetical protein [Acinetobacter sp. ASP199]|uniref:hypothetical protein n=1 Tax=unclassified Acinetobacter TaxID=196816 RepID=UPI001F616255|nr:hypothetical protein [Acinetobacter sp. ASP199]UNT59255.1 hypothetical protein IHE35_14540 [Acinetobacter sp. ASP199]